MLNVTSNFQPGDHADDHGPALHQLHARVSAADYLQLVVSGAGGTTVATDDKTKTITGTKLYFHDAATPDTGTLPGATTLSATTPSVTAATAGTNRDMDRLSARPRSVRALTTLAPDHPAEELVPAVPVQAAGCPDPADRRLDH